MVKEVELKKLEGKTQYVDWETGQELFKKSNCIPIKWLETFKDSILKRLDREEMGSIDFIKLVEEVDQIDFIIEKYKKEL